jgi:hypothetical protein
MKNMFRLFFIILVALTACCGTQEKKPVYTNGDAVNVTGNVSLAGSEPFTRIVLRPIDGKEAFFLPAELKKDKRKLIGKTVNVSGKIDLHVLKSADHKHTVYEYHIIPDKIEEAVNQSLK